MNKTDMRYATDRVCDALESAMRNYYSESYLGIAEEEHRKHRETVREFHNLTHRFLKDSVYDV